MKIKQFTFYEKKNRDPHIWTQLSKKLKFTLRPSPVNAEHAWICQERSLIAGRFRPSASSLAGAALNKSCLFANTSSGTPANFSSASNSANS